MPLSRALLSAFARVLLLTAMSPLVGCTSGPSPTVPTSLSTPGGLASGDSVRALSSPVVTVAPDTAVNGSEAQLTGFDGTSGVLSYTTTKGSFTAVFESSSVFFDAQIDKYIPVDPCRQFAINYNASGTIGDIGGVFSAIEAMAVNSCLGRIHVDKSVPPNAIRSFRPLSAF